MSVLNDRALWTGQAVSLLIIQSVESLLQKAEGLSGTLDRRSSATLCVLRSRALRAKTIPAEDAEVRRGSQRFAEAFSQQAPNLENAEFCKRHWNAEFGAPDSAAVPTNKMCGRYVRKTGSRTIADDFDVDEVVDDLQPSFNVAPTQDVAVITNDGAKRLVAMRWGLIPSWAADPTIGSRMINARSESLAEKAAFKDAFKSRRCLVVADGFYEWRKEGRAKVPLFIRLKSGRPFGLGGLYETWRPPLGELLTTCTIITTEPNELLAPIHNRMPAILGGGADEMWLDPAVKDQTVLLNLLQPYPSDEMEAYEVSTLVNSVKNDSPACIEPASFTGRLF